MKESDTVRYFDKSVLVSTLEMSLKNINTNLLSHEANKIVFDAMTEYYDLGSPEGLFRVTVRFEEKSNEHQNV